MSGRKSKMARRAIERIIDKNKREIIQNFMDDWMATDEAIGWYKSRVFVKIMGIMFLFMMATSIALLGVLIYYKLILDILPLLVGILFIWGIVFFHIVYINRVELNPSKIRVKRFNNNKEK